MFYVPQLLFPYASELATLQKLLVYGVYQLYARLCSDEVLALSSDVATLEQGLYYVGAR